MPAACSHQALGLRWRSVELLYRPEALLPLGSEGAPVFGGSRELSARPGPSLFALSLRVRLGGLGFGGEESPVMPGGEAR